MRLNTHSRRAAKVLASAFIAGLLAVTVLTVLGTAADWITLFNGKNLDGWVVRDGKGIFEVKDGILIGRVENQLDQTSFLCTKAEYGDFELEFETRIEGGNSGVQIRSRILGEEDAKKVAESMMKNMGARGGSGGGPGSAPGAGGPGSAPGAGGPGGAPGGQGGPSASGAPNQDARAGGPGGGAPAGGPGGNAPGGGAGGFASMFKAGRVWGPQVEIAPASQDGTSASGNIFGEAMADGLNDKWKQHKYFKANDWNKYRVVAKGALIQTWVNDQPVWDIALEEVYKTHPKGFIGLQLHFGTGSHSVYFRNIRIKPLD
jgi:hypothetical protein